MSTVLRMLKSALNWYLYVALLCMVLVPPSFTNADVEMQFEIRTSSDADAAAVQERLTAANFTSVYESYLDLYGSTFNSTAYDVTAVLTNTQVIYEVAQLEVTLSGARVNSVVKNSDGEWVVAMAYQSAYNTFTSPFVSRHAVVQSSDELFDSSNHPCLDTFSPCCMVDYARDYRTGNSFGQMVSDVLGDCLNPGILSTNTNDLFDMSRSQEFVENTFTGVAGASIVKTVWGASETRLTITLSPSALRDSVARISLDSDGTETIEFFVGVTFLTMLPTNAVATTVSQMNIKISTKNFVEFATVTSQAFTPVRFTQIALEQVKYLDGVTNATEYLPQSAKLLVVLNAGLRDDPSSSLIPHDSIRWAIDSAMPDITNEALWTTACTDQGYPAEDQNIYTAALEQSCGNQNARDKGICDVSVKTDASGIGEIYIPLGLNTITPMILATQSSSPLNIFIQFNIMTQDTGGRKAVSTMYVQVPLASVAMITSCDDITQSDKLDEVTDMHIAVGIATNNATETSNMRVMDNIISGAAAGLAGFGAGSGVLQPAVSYADGLISLYITGEDDFFTPSDYEIFIEDLWTVHSRDSDKTTAISTLFQNTQAFNVQTAFDGQTIEVAPHASLVSACLNNYDCVYRRDIRRRNVINPYAVHEHGSKTQAFNMDATKDWLQANILGYTPFSDALSQNFTSYVRGRKDVNDRFNKLYFINPTHKWPSAIYANPMDLLLISDTVFMYGIIVFDDGAGTRRRRLLTIGPGGTSIVPIDSVPTPTSVSVVGRRPDIDYGFNRFKRIKSYLENKVVPPTPVHAHINGELSTTMRDQIHSLAQRRKRQKRRLLSLEHATDDDITDGDITDGDTTDVDTSDVIDDENRDTGPRRSLLSVEGNANEQTGNGAGSFVSVIRDIDQQSGLQVATVVGAASNATWQILSMSFDVVVGNSLADQTREVMDAAIYAAITERITSKHMDIFPGSVSMTVFQTPDSWTISTASTGFLQEYPDSKLVNIARMKIILTWPNGTSLDSADHMVFSDKIDCAVWYGGGMLMNNSMKTADNDTPTDTSDDYQYCDKSFDTTLTDNVKSAMVYKVIPLACGDLGVVSTNCIQVSPLHPATTHTNIAPTDHGSPAHKIVLELKVPVTESVFTTIGAPFTDMVALIAGVPRTYVMLSHEMSTTAGFLHVNVSVNMHSGDNAAHATAIKALFTEDRINQGVQVSNALLQDIHTAVLFRHSNPTVPPTTQPVVPPTTQPVGPVTTPAPEEPSIVGPVIGAVLGVVAAGVLVWFYFKWRKKKDAGVGQTDEGVSQSLLKQAPVVSSAMCMKTDTFFKNGRGSEC
jgi:hypothetical protein